MPSPDPSRLEINPDTAQQHQQRQTQSVQGNTNSSDSNNNSNNNATVCSNPIPLPLQSKTTELAETTGNSEVEPSTSNSPNETRESISQEFNIQDLKCPICMDLFIEPETTDCSHTFCHYCINVWFANSPIRGRHICPQCRAVIQRTIPAQELSTKVEQYVVVHLSKELQDERESTKQNRRQESVNWRNRGRNSNRGQQRQGADIYPGYDDVDTGFWSYTVNSYRVPPTENSRNRSRSRNNSNSTTNNDNNNNMQGLLNEFEFRLDRAQRSYALVVSASREMNHQLEHLRSIAHRLERYERLLNRNRRNLASFEEDNSSNNNNNNNNDTFTLNNNDPTYNTNNSNDPSNLLEAELLDEITNATTNNNQNHQNHVNYHYADPYALWNWLATPQHYNSHRFYHPQTVTGINLSSTMTPHFYSSSMYEYSDPNSLNNLNSNNTSSDINDSYPLAFHAEYQDLISNEDNESTFLTEDPADTNTSNLTSRVRARRRNCPYYGPWPCHGHSHNSHQHHHHHCHHLNGSIDRNVRRHEHETSSLRQDEEDYLNELTNQIADHEIAEAIERSLVMDILEPQVEVSVRSSRMRSRPESGVPRRRRNNNRHDMSNSSEDIITPVISPTSLRDLLVLNDNGRENNDGQRRETIRHYSTL